MTSGDPGPDGLPGKAELAEVAACNAFTYSLMLTNCSLVLPHLFAAHVVGRPPLTAN